MYPSEPLFPVSDPTTKALQNLVNTTLTLSNFPGRITPALLDGILECAAIVVSVVTQEASAERRTNGPLVSHERAFYFPGGKDVQIRLHVTEEQLLQLWRRPAYPLHLLTNKPGVWEVWWDSDAKT